MNAKPPLGLYIASVFLIVLGGSSLVIQVNSCFHKSLSIDIGFLGILIGYRLLAGSRTALICGILFSVFGLGLTLIPIFWGHIPEQCNPTREQIWLAFLYPGLGAVLYAAILGGLCCPTLMAWCRDKNASRPDALRWTLALCFVGVLLEATSMVQGFMVQSVIQNLYMVNTHFEFCDTVTREPIQSISTPTSAESSPSPGEPRLFDHRLAFITKSSEKGVSIQVTGFASHPMDLTFMTDGRRPCTYRLDKNSAKEVVLEFYQEEK
jgi:hypothetical membrane protein